MIGIDIRGDLRPLQRAMIALRAEQVPFAMSLALNALAKGVSADQTKLLDETFDTPTPFTEKAYRIEVATKSRPVAVVAAKDIQAQYLEPYVHGGQRSYGEKKGMLGPRDVGLNKYGNLSKGKLQSLKAKPGVFIGSVRFRKSGNTVSGVWQRGATPRGTRHKGGGEHGTKGKNTNVIGGVRTTLKLLIQFEDTSEVPKRLPFEQRSRSYLKANAAREFDAALRRAMQTAR